MRTNYNKAARRKLTVLAMATAGAVSFTHLGTARADDTWIGNAATDNWSNGASWSDTTPPVAAENALIVNADNIARMITNDYSAGNALVLGNIEVDLTGGTNVNTLLMTTNTLAGASEIVGLAGNGAFVLSGGANTLSGSLTIGSNVGSTGSYSLSGTGALTVTGNEFIGSNLAGAAGTGSFTESGGTNTIGTGSNLYLGYTTTGTPPTSTYTLSGGLLRSLGGEFIGNRATTSATFTQTGGTNSATGVITTGGNYLMSGGSLAAASLAIGTSTTALSTINISNGSVINVIGAEIAGSTGEGDILQSNGTNTCATLEIAAVAAASGVVSVSGGAMTVTGNAFLGGSSTTVGGAGTLRVSGGTFTTNGTLKLYATQGKTVLSGTGKIIASALNTSAVPADFVGNGTTTGWIAGTLDITGAAGLTVSSAGPLGTPVTLKSGQILQVANALADTGGALSVTGGTATLGSISGTGTVSVSSGNLIVTGAVTNSPLTMTGGTATIGGITGAGTLTLNGGTLQIAQHSPASTQNGLTISGTGTLDMVDNQLNIFYGTNNPSPATTIRGYLSNGYNGAAWNGTGIISTEVAAKNAAHSNSHLFAVAYADSADAAVAADHFASQTVVIEPALVGDANLDGKVTFADFLLLSASFNAPNTSWDQGNFNFGATTNFSDFLLLSANFNQSTSLDNAQFAAMDQFALSNGYSMKANQDGNGFTLTAVPEPASLLMLAVGGGGLLVRRKRRPPA